MKSNELMFTTKIISFIQIPCYAVNTDLFITVTPHCFTQFVSELRLESTIVCASKLDSYIIGYTVIRLSYLVE